MDDADALAGLRLLVTGANNESWTVEAAVAEIERGAGTDFDPAVVRAFVRSRAADL